MARNDLVGVGIVTVVAIIASILFTFSQVHANSPDFNQSSTAAATTTIVYMTPGTGTTTLAYDSLDNGSDSAVLLTQFTASSTSATLAIRLQYSQNGIDWYDDNLLSSTNSTTTAVKTVNVANSYAWAAAAAGANLKAIDVPTPTRYVRAIYSVTGANAGVWASLVAKKQQPD